VRGSAAGSAPGGSEIKDAIDGQLGDKKNSRALDSGFESMPESLSSLITGQQRKSANHGGAPRFFNNIQPISVGV
jgi:hypothetical protein